MSLAALRMLTQAWASTEPIQGHDTFANTFRTISIPVGTCKASSKRVPTVLDQSVAYQSNDATVDWHTL